MQEGFWEQKHEKTFDHKHARRVASPQPNKTKFFGSVFQKRTAFLYALAAA
jgi:hypothetical protein